MLDSLEDPEPGVFEEIDRLLKDRPEFLEKLSDDHA